MTGIWRERGVVGEREKRKGKHGEGGLSVGVMKGIEPFDREYDARLLVINGWNLKRQLTLNAW